MKKIIVMMALVAMMPLLMAFAGPNDYGKKIVGKWIYYAKSYDGVEWWSKAEMMMEIREDGTMVYESEGKKVVVKWKIEDDKFIFWKDGRDAFERVEKIHKLTDKEMILKAEHSDGSARYERFKRAK